MSFAVRCVERTPVGEFPGNHSTLRHCRAAPPLDLFAAFTATQLLAVNVDGRLEAGYGTAGRAPFGFLQSASLQMRVMLSSQLA